MAGSGKLMSNGRGFPRPVPDRGSADNQVAGAAVAGDREEEMDGLHTLYARYAGDVLRYVNSLVKDRHEAEDITQNVFLKLAAALHTYEPRDVPMIAWILRIARNAALDHLYGLRGAVPIEEVPVRDQDHRQIASERCRDICWALSQLPQEQRSVVILRHIRGLSPPEIASLLGKSESSIDGLHHRGRKRVQSVLTDLGAAPVVSSRRERWKDPGL
jgi:RNA polymerase sigma-70 factor, ECF subfamily